MLHRPWPAELVSDPFFAAADTITESARVYVDLALDVLADHAPEAAVLTRTIADAPPERTRRLLQSSALRCAVFELLAALPSRRGGWFADDDTAEACAVLRDAAVLLASPADPGGLLEGHALPLGQSDDAAGFRLWSPRTPAGAGQRLLVRRFDRTIGADIDGPSSPSGPVLGAGSQDHGTVLTEAVALLGAVVPELTESVGCHVHLVALMHTPEEGHRRVLSASDSTIPGALFLSTAAVRDRLSAAEALLHEATHQRLYDLMLCRNLYAAHYSPQTSPRAIPPWYAAESGGAAAWRADRALAAFHVYVHLAVLWSAALAGPAADVLTARERPVAAARLRRCFDKGGYLLGLLRGTMRPALGAHGLSFVEFLAQAFTRLDDASPLDQTSSKEFV
jgi:HEXXH motif-containing protein